MPQKETAEKVKTLKGVAKARVPIVTKEFFAAGALSVQSWKEPPPKRTYIVRGIFPG